VKDEASPLSAGDALPAATQANGSKPTA
jgi:hypothetical protein